MLSAYPVLCAMARTLSVLVGGTRLGKATFFAKFISLLPRDVDGRLQPFTDCRSASEAPLLRHILRDNPI
jgi:hypothetical protein